MLFDQNTGTFKCFDDYCDFGGLDITFENGKILITERAENVDFPFTYDMVYEVYGFVNNKLILIESRREINEYPQACLAAGTKVLMTDDSYKNIEDVQVGDFVVSFEVKTKSRQKSKVSQVIKRKDPLVIINDILRTAPDEPVYLADGSVQKAVDINIGDYLFNEKGNGTKVNTVEYSSIIVDTYDLILKDAKTFFANGYLVRTPDP
jgi:hypothetical protein